jgi:uncharacterized protein (DUF488 family)
MGATHELFTVGYAGEDLDSFLAKLKQHAIEAVVDIRQNPVSRKRGFSRSALSTFLSASSLQYVHESELGVPSELRRALRDGEQELTAYLDEFRVYLTGHEGALERLYHLVTRKRCCLLCVERRPEECHRSVVADAIASLNGQEVKVIHL